MNEDLRKWFGKGEKGGVGGGGWDRYNTKGERIGKCAREPGEPKPKCLSKEKAAKMSKDQIAAAVRRKREADPVADRPGKGGTPKMVSNKIKENYSNEEERYCPLCDKREARSECSYGEKTWDKVSVKDEEYSMVRRQLDTMLKSVEKIQDKVGKGEGDLESWIQAKITKAADYIDTAADYINTNEEKDPCWKGYKQVGMKKKGGKMVPNCVKKKNTRKEEVELSEVSKKLALKADAMRKKREFDAAEDGNDKEMDKQLTKSGKFKSDENRRRILKKHGDGAKKDLNKNTYKVHFEEGAMPDAIDPKKHRQQQRAAKIRTLAQKGSTEGERAAAEKKTKGPKMFGEDLKLVDKILLEMEAEVLNEKNVPTNPSLWSKMKSRAKAKFDVYPSAYANGWAAKEYKKAGGGWKSVKEDIEEAVRMPAKTGNLMFVMTTWRGRNYSIKVFFPQTKRPTRSEIEDKMQGVYPGCKVRYADVVALEPGEQFLQVSEAIDKDAMKCNKPKAQAVGDSLTGKSHVVKACEGGKEKIIRFGQRGVKGSPKKEGESEEYANRRKRFKTRHAKNIAKGKMSAAYWANKVKW